MTSSTGICRLRAHPAGGLYAPEVCWIRLSYLVLPMYELRNRRPGYKVSMIKTAMSLAGIPAGGVRPPLVAMDAADREDLRSLMERHGLLAA